MTAPGEDCDRDTVGLSGWLLAPGISGADVLFTHPFGRDWECLVALDPRSPGCWPRDPAALGFAQAQVSFQFTHRAGVGVQVIGNWLAWPFLS